MPEHKATKDTSEKDRDVVRCKVCGLVQYRTRTGNCRRCLRLLPPPVEFMLPPPTSQELPGDDRQLFENWPNRDTVENIGLRIRNLRESRGMTQSQLQARSRVSRSYLSRIESGQMTPSLGTLEKIAEALGVGLNRFFIPETAGQVLMEDPFIQGLRPYLRQLDADQWQWILKRLQAITDNVVSRNSPPATAATGSRGGVIQAPRPSSHPVPTGSRHLPARRTPTLPGRNGVRSEVPPGSRNAPAAREVRVLPRPLTTNTPVDTVTRKAAASAHWGPAGGR